MQFIRKNYSYIAIFLVVYAFMFGIYYVFSVGIPDKTFYLQTRRYIPCALAVTLALYFWNKAKLSNIRIIPNLFVALSWAIIFPMTDWLCLHKSVTFLDNHFDMAFAAYSLSALVSIQLILLKYAKGIMLFIGKIMLSVLQTVLMVVPIVALGYFQYYGSSISPAACMAAIQTNPNEAKEFVLQNIGIAGIIGIAVAFGVMFTVFYFLNNIKSSDDRSENAGVSTFSKKMMVAVSFVGAVSLFYGSSIFMLTGVMNAYDFAKQYFDAAEKFKQYHQSNFANLTVNPNKPQFDKPSTIIMVIGESASRTFMSAYNSKIKNNNTPWMKAMSQNDSNNFLLFKHAYTSWGQTVPSLERALTEKNQYNDKEFNQSLTIIDIAKKAGYDTYWFSGQGTISDADTPITLVAETANHGKWLEETQKNRTTSIYDGELIDLLKEVNPTKNNFIVLHVMGSHDRYFNRYPKEFTKFGDGNPEDYPTTYDNSLAYTDWILEEIYKYGKEKLNLQAMMYFSDHGANPYGKRLAENSPFVALRVPLFIYLSDEYEQKFPQTTAALKSHLNSYYTNDLTYDTICGLLNIKSNHYDETNSLTSDKYKFNRNNLTTRLGKSKLTEDTNEEK